MRLVYWDGLRQDQVAAALDLPVHEVREVVARGMRHLADRLRE